MKNQIIISLLFGMSLLVGSGYAQKTNDQNQPVERELSLKQQLAVLQAGKDNPVKAQPLEIDDRMNHHKLALEKDFGLSNDKAQPIEEVERRPENQQQLNLLPEDKVMPMANEGTNTQPIGVKSETIINYRGENVGNSQSQPEKSGNAIEYRSIKGGNEQPVGKIPEK